MIIKILKIIKNFIVLFFLFILSFSAFSKNEINLYSARQEVLMRPLIDEFENNTNIKVNIISAKANQLINRIIKEGEYTNADILLTSDVARLIAANKKKLLTKANSKELEKLVPDLYRDKNYKWIGLSLRARFFVYNKENVNKYDLKGYFNLSSPQWKNKILVRSSNNVYNQSLVAAMILNYGEEKVKTFLKNFVGNFARSPSGGDRDQIRAVLAGEGDIALVNSYYFLKMKAKDDTNKYKSLEIHFPKDEKMLTHVNISGAAIIKYTKNYDNALKFLEFMVSDKAQSIYANINYEYPIRSNTNINNFMSKYNNYEKDKLKLELVGKVNKKAMLLMDKAGWR